ncbi:MAG TPA: family 10 glycosylhydrolase [Gemmatimonadaceae bacterium]|nr:family 10 glycosylhydrolase [Gemmatimonadaceae bacterium]
MDRREFIETSGVLAGGAMLKGIPGTQPAPKPPMVGIQVGAVSFVDEGTDRVLDGLREMASINTLFVASFTYGRGIAGRQLPNQPLPDHGKQEYDTATFRGGNYATPHPQYYRNTSITPERAPDHPGYDVLADVLPRAHQRGMKVIAWFEDVIAGNVPGFDQAREVVLTGSPSTFACSRNPNTRNFWLGLVADYLRSYDIDGLMWGSERQGPLGSVLGTNHGGTGAGGRVACFCQYCTEAARQQGINVDRARQGFTELTKWSAAVAGGQKPADGAFVTFWRLLVRYPEILAWERLWNEALYDTYRDMYKLAHEIAPAKGMGWHIWHNNSFSPFYRAEQDYAEFSQYSDFLKVVMYGFCGGERLAQYVRGANRSLFADLTPDATLALTYDLQQYHDRPLNELAAAGLGPDYVRRETARALAAAGPTMKIWPGIDVDIPTAATSKKSQPADVYEAVKAAFAEGAHGVLLSRKYSEMRLDNIRAAGRAVRDLKLV